MATWCILTTETAAETSWGNISLSKLFDSSNEVNNGKMKAVERNICPRENKKKKNSKENLLFLNIISQLTTKKG